ncbi:MAG TPA: helix-turn-helix domain-containing protein [Flavobacterium sp.]|jgi:transcriptional regulator with XRE-family HTH domain|uniref:helix-turn-helix domain-containing protein n=1 Tax=Flavobacterium sp. TaxID=239 RepID=UPI002B636EEC|nr:helix-turn-helix domain-containing protein [Flavobacterium sp.]HPW97794.1 helix-turn-helix domain-containing protein [Flavobacterium sp.]HQA73936.1 helix-turn-helix domain-containing protein [Flavobacterium sp.]
MFDKNNSVKIGSKLRKLRISKGYSQEYMAETLKISQKTYSNMENDKSSISIDTLKKIAQEYEIDLLDILSDEKVVVQNNNSHDASSFQGGIIFNQLSEELLNQFKERIEDLKKVIEDKNKIIEILEKQL